MNPQQLKLRLCTVHLKFLQSYMFRLVAWLYLIHVCTDSRLCAYVPLDVMWDSRTARSSDEIVLRHYIQQPAHTHVCTSLYPYGVRETHA